MLNLNDLEVNRIGEINNGVDGTDCFYQVKSKLDTEVTVEQVREVFDHAMMYEGNGPGTAYCPGCSVVKQEYHKDVFLVTAHHRYDN